MQDSKTVSFTSVEQLNLSYKDLQNKCQQIEDFEDPGLSFQSLIEKFTEAQKYIASNSLFSANESVKEINTENLKFLTLPYYIGFLFGKISTPRKDAILQSRNYLEAYLNLVSTFNSEDEQLFPENIKKTWFVMKKTNDFNIERDQVIANHKEKKLIQNRYSASLKLKEESDQRQSAKDFIMLKVYEAVTQLKNIQEEIKILQYKDQIEKDPEMKQLHQAKLQEPIPKLKVWEVKKPEQIQQDLIPKLNSLSEKRTDLVAQVWQENANKPTITLQQVADMEYDNMIQRMARQKKQKEENVQDTDSDKQVVDDREKKKSRAWDDWKDDNEKGAGNRGNR